MIIIIQTFFIDQNYTAKVSLTICSDHVFRTKASATNRHLCSVNRIIEY